VTESAKKKASARRGCITKGQWQPWYWWVPGLSRRVRSVL